jgi:hypothetical protein
VNSNCVVGLGVVLSSGCAGSLSGSGSIPPPPSYLTASAPADGHAPSSTAPASQALSPDVDDAYDDEDPSALRDFTQTLEGHGRWAADPTYGTVWVPNPAEVGANFVPYETAGHWVYSSDFVWVSAYDWGWVPFHYGRWLPLRDGSWGWIPGRKFAPSWVDWKVAGEYVGWAPIAPTFVWIDGVAREGDLRVLEPYVYCPKDGVFSATPASDVVTGTQSAALDTQSRSIAPSDGPGEASDDDSADDGTGSSAVGLFVSVDVGGARSPSPAALGISDANVVHFKERDPGVAHAQAFARPPTAVPLGARPPTRVSGAARPPRTASEGRSASAQRRPALAPSGDRRPWSGSATITPSSARPLGAPSSVRAPPAPAPNPHPPASARPAPAAPVRKKGR